LFGMRLFGPFGSLGMTLSLLVAYSMRSQWWIESKSWLGSGFGQSALRVPAPYMSGRCSPSCVWSTRVVWWSGCLMQPVGLGVVYLPFLHGTTFRFLVVFCVSCRRCWFSCSQLFGASYFLWCIFGLVFLVMWVSKCGLWGSGCFPGRGGCIMLHFGGYSV
jgi:hypothetical protein